MNASRFTRIFMAWLVVAAGSGCARDEASFTSQDDAPLAPAEEVFRYTATADAEPNDEAAGDAGRGLP